MGVTSCQERFNTVSEFKDSLGWIILDYSYQLNDTTSTIMSKKKSFHYSFKNYEQDVGGDFCSLFWFEILTKGLKALLTDGNTATNLDVTKQILKIHKIFI